MNPYTAVLALAKEVDGRLLCTDGRLRRCVLLHHEDGSHFFWDSAFYLRARTPGSPPPPTPPGDETTLKDIRQYDREYECDKENRWIVVFTEHHNVHAYSEDELTYFAQFERFWDKNGDPLLNDLVPTSPGTHD